MYPSLIEQFNWVDRSEARKFISRVYDTEHKRKGVFRETRIIISPPLELLTILIRLLGFSCSTLCGELIGILAAMSHFNDDSDCFSRLTCQL